MKKTFITIITILTVTFCGCMAFFQYNSYDEASGLYAKNELFVFSQILFAACILFALIFSVTQYNGRFWKASGESEAEEEESSLSKVNLLVRRSFDKGQFVFLVASLMIFFASTIFRTVKILLNPSLINIILLFLSVGLLWGMARCILINLMNKTKSYDAVVLLLPTVYAAVYTIYEYRNLACIPQLSIHNAEVLTMLTGLLCFFLFSSHFFGRGSSGLMLFLALVLVICGAETYICQTVKFARLLLSGDAVADEETFETMAKLFYYAASAIFGGVYSSLLLRDSYSFMKEI